MSRSALRESRPFLARAIGELPTLLYGVEARWNQMQLLQGAASLAQQEPMYLQMASEVAAWSWQQRPLDKGALLAMVSLQQQAPVLSPQGRVVAGILNRHLQAPEVMASGPDVIAQVQKAQAARQAPESLLELVNAPGVGLFWLGEVFDALLDEGEFELAREVLERTGSLGSLPQIGARLQAEWAMAALPLREALGQVAAVDEALFPHWRQAARASLLLREDDSAHRQEAASILLRLWRQLPWHVNTCLTAYELAQPLALASPEDMAGVCVALYSWNKAEDLNRTLGSLAQSVLGGAHVVCLDNGSTDATPKILQQAQQQWRRRGDLPELELVRLPVNIGAPAARDWLLALPQVRNAAYVAFLDDDIFLPQDWLAQLLARAEATPHVSAVGCRIERHKAPHLLQAADFHLLPPELGGGGFKDFTESIHVCNNGLGRRDSGLFHYSRPCVSVTGCCHLLRRESLERKGGFDIRFGPSQFDDLERDLRVYAGGESNVYHGALAVRHVQYSSLQQAADRARQSHIHGNKIKLEHLFTRQDVQRMAARNRRMLETDFTAKAVALDNLAMDSAE